MSDAARRTIPGLRASGVAATDEVRREIRGSTTILELLRMFPDGSAAKLMSDIQFPCAHCGGAVREHGEGVVGGDELPVRTGDHRRARQVPGEDAVDRLPDRI